jgi:predicted transporter
MVNGACNKRLVVIISSRCDFNCIRLRHQYFISFAVITILQIFKVLPDKKSREKEGKLVAFHSLFHSMLGRFLIGAYMMLRTYSASMELRA